jgi:hypothetical protein
MHTYSGSTSELVPEIIHDGLGRPEQLSSLAEPNGDPAAGTILPGLPARRTDPPTDLAIPVNDRARRRVS